MPSDVNETAAWVEKMQEVHERMSRKDYCGMPQAQHSL